jgi:Outer membrane protein beta-barrel domain
VFVKVSVQTLAVCTLTILVTSAAVPAAAQTAPRVDLSVGYETEHIPGQNYPFGVNADVSGALTGAVRLVGEVGMALDQQSVPTLNGTLSLYHYGVGPRFSATFGKVSPFAQIIAGGVHTRADLVLPTGAAFSASDNAFMLQPGVGVLVSITRHFGVVGQVDYRRVFFKQGGDNETRVFGGARIAFR